MNKEGGNPVDVVESFLAMQGTRKEAAQRLGIDHGQGAADRAIAQLMAELSMFGDAAKGTGQEDNEYLLLWNDTLGGLGSMDEAQKRTTFERMEAALARQYEKALSDEADLPPTIREVLQQQAAEISAKGS